jgi:hypothetical protein
MLDLGSHVNILLEGDHKVPVTPCSEIIMLLTPYNGSTSDQKGLVSAYNEETSDHKGFPLFAGIDNPRPR